MKNHELTELMHSVLDGQAAPEDVQVLEARLAADPAARAEYDAWQRLFGVLGQMPLAAPPEGMAAAIEAAARHRETSAADSFQPFGQPGVIGHGRSGGRTPVSRSVATFRRFSRSDSIQGEKVMSEQQSAIGSGNRKLWVGGAVAALAVGIAMFAFDYPPKSENVVGTIAPAERYRAAGTAEAVKLGDQTIAQLMQNDSFDRMVKDPELKALSQDAGMRSLARILAKNPEASRVMVAHVEASKAAAENVALAQKMMQNVDMSRAVYADLRAGRTPAADRMELAKAMSLKLDAANAILANVDASRMALAAPQAALAIAANVEASRMMLKTEANLMNLNRAEAQLMMQKMEANRAEVQRAQAELVNR
jgi:anti-sigma factor RsiW